MTSRPCHIEPFTSPENTLHTALAAAGAFAILCQRKKGECRPPGPGAV